MNSTKEHSVVAGSVIKDLPIPPRPAVIMILQEELAKPEPELDRVKQTIAKDVGISGAMLKLVNSSAFSLSRKVTSVPQAIDIIGLRNVTNLATGIALRQQMGSGKGNSLERFWDSAEKVATLCAYLARQLRGIPPDEAYTYGLFHDCGIAVLMQHVGNYREVLAAANVAGEESFTTVEDRLIGTNHAVVGYFVARSWSLAKPLCRAIQLHHDLDAFTGEAREDVPCLNYVAIGHLSAHIHHLTMRSSIDHEWEKFGAAVLAHFGLDEEDFVNLVDNAGQSLQDSQTAA